MSENFVYVDLDPDEPILLRGDMPRATKEEMDAGNAMGLEDRDMDR